MDSRRNKLCYGYIREYCMQSQLYIPRVITDQVLSFYFRNFAFDRTHNQFEISEDGLTQTTVRSRLKHGRPTNKFGEFLYHKYGDRFECTFRLDGGGHSGLIIGFITDGFNEFHHHSDSSSSNDTLYACLAAANGWFKIDDHCFKSADGSNRTHHHSNFQFMKSAGDTLTVTANMKHRTGKIGKYNIELPDNIAVVICSNSGHKISVVRYSLNGVEIHNKDC
eukprot:249656_1